MGSENSTFRILNIIRLKDIGLHHDGCRPPRYHPTSIIQMSKVRSIAEGIISSGTPLFYRGEWFLDSRYKLKDLNLDVLDRGPDDKITVYKVGLRGVEGEREDRTTASEDAHCFHGGLYYVGIDALKYLLALRSKTQELFDAMLCFSDTEATTRRYPYPIRILKGPTDTYDDVMDLHEAIYKLYKAWSPEIQVVQSPGSIRLGHYAVLDSVEHGRPVLVIDPDFRPNGHPSLMYELKGEEKQYTHLWNVRNPINDLEYGHGSPKLLCRPFFDLTEEGEDMTMSCSTKGVTIHGDTVGEHGFNSSPMSVYRTTLREVFKLTRAAAEDMQALSRLRQWIAHSEGRPDTDPYRQGVLEGFGLAKGNPDFDINDYDELHKLGETHGFD